MEREQERREISSTGVTRPMLALKMEAMNKEMWVASTSREHQEGKRNFSPIIAKNSAKLNEKGNGFYTRAFRK